MMWVAITIVLGQGLIAVVFLRILKTFGVYAESLLYTHQQNLEIRKNLAQQENDIAAREILRKYTSPNKEIA
jgi:hypothetical protein